MIVVKPLLLLEMVSKQTSAYFEPLAMPPPFRTRVHSRLSCSRSTKTTTTATTTTTTTTVQSRFGSHYWVGRYSRHSETKGRKEREKLVAMNIWWGRPPSSSSNDDLWVAAAACAGSPNYFALPFLLLCLVLNRLRRTESHYRMETN